MAVDGKGRNRRWIQMGTRVPDSNGQVCPRAAGSDETW
jgi:hypothetical protein